MKVHALHTTVYLWLGFASSFDEENLLPSQAAQVATGSQCRVRNYETVLTVSTGKPLEQRDYYALVDCRGQAYELMLLPYDARHRSSHSGTLWWTNAFFCGFDYAF